MTGTLSTPTAPTDFPSLTHADRCDRCGAQAYVRVVLAGGGDLLFCAHHAKAYDQKLRELALMVVDETDKLDPASGR